MGRFRLPAVSSRSGMEGILKGTEKSTGAAKAGIQCNLCHGELCGQQKVSGIIKSSGIHISGKVVWNFSVNIRERTKRLTPNSFERLSRDNSFV